MSLSVRLNLLVVLLLLLLAIAGAATVVVNARAAVTHEIESSVSLTLGLLTAAGAATDAAGLTAMRTVLAERLSRLEQIRHLDIALLGPDGLPLLPVVQAHAQAPAQAPRWFVALVRPTTVEYRHRIGAPGVAPTEIAIRPNPADEITEAWVQSRAEVLLLLSFAAVAMLLISFTVSRAFRPVGQMLSALDVIQGGDYSARLAEPRLPELQRIAVKLNSMAEQLERHERDNRALRKRALAIQEAERRTLAQELHDELGQSISAMKALAVSIAQRAADAAEARQHAGTIASICDDLYGTVRNMTKRLRPVVLDELGLAIALRRLVEEWNEHHQGATCALAVDGDLAGLDEEGAIGVYRIVQEGLTNAARHAGATEVRIAVSELGEGRLQVRVEDNGCGFDPQRVRDGLGLLGIRERALSLGGEVRIAAAPGRGTTIALSIPVARPGVAPAVLDAGAMS